MAGQHTNQGPDLALGVAVAEFPTSGPLEGHVGDDPVLLARSGEELAGTALTLLPDLFEHEEPPEQSRIFACEARW